MSYDKINKTNRLREKNIFILYNLINIVILDHHLNKTLICNLIYINSLKMIIRHRIQMLLEMKIIIKEMEKDKYIHHHKISKKVTD